MRVAGFSLALPAGWQAAARRQDVGGTLVVHAATIALPRARGDFGSDVAPLLGTDDVFCSLFEYDRSSTETVLFSARGLPVVRPSDFTLGALQRSRPGQSGAQFFFTEAGRAFCLFAILGSHSRRVPGAAKVNGLVRGMAIS
ncbi:MAG: hypothetical protein QOG99_2422 [Frankiales bacterium]|jgi:hypothetical protein|nr:hypothetical protein [Frankiales bacterium]